MTDQETKDRATLIVARLVANKLVRLSVVPFLSGFVGYGVAFLVLRDWLEATGLAAVAFGLVGLTEVATVRHEAKLIDLAETLFIPEHATETGAWLKFLDKFDRKWTPIVLEEKMHRGMIFRSVGAEQFPLPLMLAGPFCPRCKGDVLCRVATVVPAFVYRFHYYCDCGFESLHHVSPRQLFSEAKAICRLPV